MATVSKIFFGGRLGASWLLTAYADLSYAFQLVLDPYRPERHYMRGPGPKCQAKHDHIAVMANP
jgi:hypothetical protein